MDVEDELNPSELGTKVYWDKHYQMDLENRSHEEGGSSEPSHLESWFDDVGAPEKVSGYLTSADFPLFSHDPTNDDGHLPRVLDLGTGNGSTLISLALEEGIRARMVGVDYSEPSILLARQCWSNMLASHTDLDGDNETSIDFAIFDLLHDDPTTQVWWPEERNEGHAEGFDLVLDKGTFDAISLSSDVITDANGEKKKAFEAYASKVEHLVRPGGYFLITSCNWTGPEVIKRFSMGEMKGIFNVFHQIVYAVYSFGGQQGQGVASICFRKTAPR